MVSKALPSSVEFFIGARLRTGDRPVLAQPLSTVLQNPSYPGCTHSRKSLEELLFPSIRSTSGRNKDGLAHGSQLHFP